MRAPVPRFVRWTVVLAVVVALTVAVFQYWSTLPYQAAISNTPINTPTDGWTLSPWGPLRPADRDLVVKVWQTGLYAESTGRQAQRQASSAQIRTTGMRIATEYGDLDKQVLLAAKKLDVPLPNQPDAQQQTWTRELSRLSGPYFDQIFIQQLRYTLGGILPIIADVRANTRNHLIRSVVVAATVLVNQHMEFLEHTGLVDYSALSKPSPYTAGISPTGVVPTGRDQHGSQIAVTTGGNASSTDASPADRAQIIVATVIYAAVLLGAAGLLHLLRNTANLGARRYASRRLRYAIWWRRMRIQFKTSFRKQIIVQPIRNT